MRSKIDVILTLALIILLLGLVGGANAQSGPPDSTPVIIQTVLGTAFTYQGKISNNGSIVNGNCDMAFRLFDAQATGNQIGSAITTTVPVTNSRFTVALDFGAGVFAGQARWLELRADCGGGYVTLNPRQAITAAPEALHAKTADSALWESDYYPLYLPQTLDLTAVDSGLKGFTGGFTDGRYGYFVPDAGFTSGKVARLDLYNFTTTGVTTVDLTTVDAEIKGFDGGFTDGLFGYFVPNFNGTTFSGKVARINLQSFNLAGVQVLDLSTVDTGLTGFSGGFTDGIYAYFVPYNSGTYHGKIARVNVFNFSGVTVLDLTTADPDLKGFQSGFTDGRYGYFVPSNNGAEFGKVARVDLQNFTASGVTTLDLTAVDPDLKGFTGGFTDGRYGYLVPSNNGAEFGKVARVDLQNFTASGVTTLDLTAVDPDLKGFSGGFTDGRFGYFVPFYQGAFHGNVARVDFQNFTQSGVTVLDLATVDADLQGFRGGFTDGRYGYFVPANNNNGYFGKIARIQLFFGGGSP